MTLTLGVIVASIRPGRVGDKVGAWVAEHARAHGGFEVDLIDLAEVDLPLRTDEPNHPVTGNYVHDYTKAWSRRVAGCQAFVIVTPEYNHGYPASIKNALDLVNREWWYKPVGFASYGGVSGGLRAVEQIRQIVTFLRMMPAADAFVAPFVFPQIADGVFTPSQIQEQGTTSMLDELVLLAEALVPLQQPSPVA
jgi:NAD(P)H-dependent FMN reductase